jgi:tRNA modification GTPase
MISQGSSDTIVAQATPPGRGGIGVVRVSGPLVPHITEQILHRTLIEREATFCQFWDEHNQLIDQGIAIYFVAPASFTGETMLELQSHGSQAVIQLLIERVLALGARLAEPGEFSRRAFLNKKIDLTQAEAIADIINATSVQAAKSAARSLRGEFSLQINDLLSKLINLRVQIEGMIDFPEEEDLPDLANGDSYRILDELLAGLRLLISRAKDGVVLQEGIKVVIIGNTNAGKSTLFNRLSGQEYAIVTDIPGTTRDLLREILFFNGVALKLCDTAGFRANLDPVADPVETEGIRRTEREILEADHILFIVDGANEIDDSWRSTVVKLGDLSRVTLVYNKSDLLCNQKELAVVDSVTTIHISAKYGQGMEQLISHLQKLAGGQNINEGFGARRRHVDSLRRVEKILAQTANTVDLELFAHDLAQAQQVLSEITGAVTNGDILNAIFDKFCIGK